MQNKMQLFIYFSLALVAFSSAEELKEGPKISDEKPSSSEPSQKIDKRFVTQEFNLYLTPEEVKSLQTVKSYQNPASIDNLKQTNSGISQESYNDLIQKFYAENLTPAPIKEPQVEQPAQSKFFLPREESVFNKKPNFNFNYRQLLIDQTKLSGQTQNVRKNKFNQLPNPSVSDSDLGLINPVFNENQEEKLLHKQLNEQWNRLLNHNRAQLKVLSSIPEKQQNKGNSVPAVLALSKQASDSNRNEEQRKSAEEKEDEYVLRNGQIYQLKQLNSPAQVNNQNSDRNGGQKKSAVEKEIENVWRQHQAFEFERSNPEVGKQSSSANNKNQENTEVRHIEYNIRDGQAYGFEISNAPAKINKQGPQVKNEGQIESEIGKQIGNVWIKQQQNLYVPAGVINQGPTVRNEKQLSSEVDKQIENILRQISNSPADVNPSGRNENQDNTEINKQISLILENNQANFERDNAEVNNRSPSLKNADQNKSDVEEEIQNILKKHQNFELQKSKATAEAINQSPPILIHKHVKITKHLPIPVLKNVEVHVPTPVLVPIPQPYEVKVPHLYPVPLEVVKHIPIPVVRQY